MLTMLARAYYSVCAQRMRTSSRTATLFRSCVLSVGCCSLLLDCRGAASFVVVPRQNDAVHRRASLVMNPALTVRHLSDVPKKDQSFPTWSFDEPCTSMAWSPVSEVTLTMAPDGGTVESLAKEADLVVLGVTAPAKEGEEEQEESEDEDEDEKEKEEEPVVLEGLVASINDELGGALKDVMEENRKDFSNGAKMASMTPTLRVVGNGGSTRYVAMGLGRAADDKDWTAEGFKLGKAVATKCNAEKKVATAHVLLPADVTSNATVVQDFASAFYEELYADNRYRTGAKVKHVAEDLKKVVLISEGTTGDAAADSLEAGKKLATGVYMTKDIVNAPHNVLNSVSLADTAERLAEESGGRLQCTILSKEECEERGMGAYLGVARASETEPKFIHLTYRPEGEVNKKVACVGKGLLFDTGGYNIKTQMMELMKFDCGGAAAVLGAARAVAALAPPGVEAHFIVAACENMIGERGVVPSDILTASNGKTIEVMNTDAEGRLTLADALVYADKELGCESIIELSTLTGACMVALGKQICGVWTSNDDLASELEDISKTTGDKSWRMPLAKEYNEQLESKFADMKNVGTRYGGSITAALFLQHFVSKKKKFAHIDIAGPVWNDKSGATGFGAKLVTEWVARQGKADE